MDDPATMPRVGEAGVATGAPVPAQARHGGPLAVGRHLAADLSHVTNLDNEMSEFLCQMFYI